MISPSHLLSLACLAIVAASAAATPFAPATGPLSIPPRHDLAVDGDLSDWLSGPFTAVTLFADNAGRAANPRSHAASLRLAWSKTHLIVGLDVHDDLINEANGSALWRGDAFVMLSSPGETGDQPIVFMLTPGVDSNGQTIAPRTLLNDNRKDPALRPIPVEPLYATQRHPSGYRMEVAMPLAALGLGSPQIGDRFSLQVEVKDRDESDEVVPLEWHPGQEASRNASSFHLVTLASEPDTRPAIAPKARLIDEATAEILVFADPSQAGQILTARFPTGVTQTAPLAQDLGLPYAEAKFSAPFERSDAASATASLLLAHQLLARFDFNQVAWVDSQRGYAPIPSLAAMQRFEADRRANGYDPDALLVIGSSSIRMWDTIKEDLAPWPVIQRGFGGSTMSEVMGAYRYLVEPYKGVTRFLIYEGDNDSARGDQKAFIKHARDFIERINRERAGSTIAFITPKPAPARAHLWDNNYAEAHRMLYQLADQHDNVHVIDVSTPLMDSEGNIREDLFVGDRVHLNEAGYDLWTEAIRSRLDDIFGPPPN